MSDSKEAICEALRACMERQPLASISIQGVCDKAGLSRKTFSRNFSDLQDVVAYQMYLDFVKPMYDVVKIMSAFTIDNATLLERNLHTLRQYASYYDNVVHVFGRAWFVEKLAKLSLDIDLPLYQEHNLNEIETSFVEHFFAYAVPSSYLWWVENGMEPSEKDMARMMNEWIYARALESNA